MKNLSNKGYKILKLIHILSASIWIGSGVVVLFLLTFVLNKNNLSEIILAVHYIDLLIIIPSNILTFITGIIFSTFTNWKFFKHKWIMLKYCINVVPMILGGIIFVPSIFNMFSIIKIMGENAIVDISFIKSKNIFIASLVIILAILLMAVCLTVFKPKLKVQRNNRQFSVI